MELKDALLNPVLLLYVHKLLYNNFISGFISPFHTAGSPTIKYLDLDTLGKREP